MKARISYTEAKVTFNERDDAIYWKLPTKGKRKKGSKAGSVNNVTGQVTVEVGGVNHQVSHIVWLLHNKEYPTHRLEHIDGDKENNNITNLKLIIPESTNITYELVHRLFNYVDGHLVWKNKLSVRSQIKIGEIAGAISKQKYSEYRYIKIGGLRYKSANLVWLYHKGFLPTMMLDHINHISIDDRIENLRDVSNRENTRNQNLRITNKSGISGVTKCHGKWLARVTDNMGERLCLGSFDDKFEAICARRSAEIKYGYHPNHGKHAA